MKLLLYCTKAIKQKDLLWSNSLKHFFLDGAYNRLIDNLPNYLLNGKIVAECDFEVEKLQIVYGKGWETKTIKGTENIEKLTCLSREKLYQYCKGNGYAIHIKNLHIFDKSKELSEYGMDFPISPIVKAPQNMMKVWEDQESPRVLISIRPEWLCKILNGEKTIEVRKKVLKEML